MITFKQWRSWPRYEQNGVGQQQQNHQQAPWYQCHNYQFTSELSNNSSSNSNNNSNSNTINKKKKMPSSVKNGDTGVLQPGWIDVWRLWRHCLCRFGWYPLFVAPLVTVACLLDLYSSTGCDFIRMDIGFRPANDVWSDSHAQLGLFSFDGNEMDRNKWKRAFNNGCRPYTDNFVNVFIEQDQTWHISRIMAYISGIASLVALATAWLLTITPLPASFFWPGVLLPAVVLAMLSGAAKFFFFSAQICSEPFWFMDETSSEAVAAESCEIGESSVFGIASVAAYFFCTILICFRSPQKRILDENFGRRSPHDHGSTISHRTQNTPSDIICNHQSDPEQGHAHASDGVNHHHYKSSSGNNNNNNNNNLDSGMERRESMLDSQRTTKHKNNNTTPKVIQHGPQHTRNTSDVTWSTGSNKNVQHNALQERSRNLGVLSPATKEETEEEVARAEEYSYGRPIVVTINDNSGGGNSSNMSKQSMSYSDGSTTQSSSKSHGPSRGSSGGGSSLPPRHNGKSTVTSANPTSLTHGNSRHESDSGSIQSRISKLSLADTQVSDEMSALGMNSYAGSSSHKSAPSVVAIPTHRRSGNHNMTAFATGVTASPGGTTATTTSSASSSSATTSSASVGKQKKKKLRYAKNRSHCAREDSRNDHVNFSNEHGTSSLGRDEYGGLLPPLDEMSASAGAPPSHTITRSFDMIDHGDLINKCVRDLENSFADGADDNKNRFRTM